MALPVYAEADPLPDVPDEVELQEDEPGTASGEDTALPEQNAATPVPDAATPEPEQSAEPEQPAPTETPEPTAEPTLTPEPAATATATPVPTVTPTATPEPTEQPQKMYAARSVGNVQAVSEQENTKTHTLYFAVPKSWENYTKVKIHAVGEGDPAKAYYLDMQEADKTKDGRKIYSAVLKEAEHYPHGGLNGLEFCGYTGDADTIDDKNPAYKIIISEVGKQNPPWMTFNPGDTNNYIGGDYYDGNQGNGNLENGWDRTKWKDYTVGHKHFANKPMAFENKTSETLTNVKAWFYEPNDKGTLEPVGAPILLNSDESGSGIAPNSTATFTIPDGFCSFVRFTAGDNDTEEISEYYNFYNEKVTGENQNRFQYSESQCYCYMYNGIDDATWGRPGATRIYYDATFSKMALNGDTNDYSIPKANNKPETIYYRIKAEGKDSESGTLVKDSTNENLYYIDIPQGYSSIIFSGEKINRDDETKGNGVSTAWLTIPTDGNNCFYADTNDDAVYTNGQRGGYWAPKGTKRDAETWKEPKTKVVDIASADFTEDPDTKYVTSTLYDYYTDYELNGKNRDGYDQSSPAVSYRNWVPFREFDQALSDYYKTADAKYPLYTGHFQPSYSNWGYRFDGISAALNLWGLNSDFKDENRFMAINNSTINENGNGEFYDYAYQGLVESKTSTGDATGKPLLKDTKVAEPHFDEAFLSGTNTKNAKLGNVYNNVAFPFTKRQIFNEDQGVDYWYFDSQDTTLYLKQDSKQDQYFLKSSTDVQEREKSRNLKSDSASKTISKNGKDVSSYGYFPFNETATGGVASTYNYGFGTKLQMDFTLTDDGKVETDVEKDGKKEKTNIKFFFSGDDDVWVFIDGQLALDVGGAHGKVSGLLEFGETKDGKKNSVTAYVSQVKKGGTSNSDQTGGQAKSVRYNGENITFSTQGTTLELDKNKKHTLTMYYMERGMWESNMAVAFNFPDNNELQVQKEVDLTNVNTDFQDCFKNQKIFTFTIQNQATHYGTKDAVGSDADDSQYKKVNLTAAENEIKPATESTEGDYIFKLDANPGPDSGTNTEKVLHWYARYQDTEPVSNNRDKRYGILTLNQAINIKDERFLTFEVYVDPNDGGNLSLNNLYLELLDDKGVQKGSLGTSGINGATYGSVEVKKGKWVTVKLDLNKMKTSGNFDNNVKTIRVGDNYSRHIYFRNFTFIPKAVPSVMSGFTTDQKDIPDYGSATTGQLQNAENAQYTSTKDKDTQLVDGNGRFVLEDGETVTFSDQFRRGSYISLKEKLNTALYDTTWTVYENGRVVTSTYPDDTSNVQTVTFGEDRSLEKQSKPPKGPDDGRTEKMGTGEEQPEENKYNGTKPSADTIVFRSYKDPDETSSTLTKLKVKYVNTVKTGGLKIQKKAADGEENSIKGTYKFKVTFNDVGGEGLEKEPIIKYVEINMNDSGEHTGTITGIPVGTRYTIEEVTPQDGSRLQSVTVPKGQSARVIKNNTMVEGEIKESKDPNDPNNPNNLEVTAIFTNTRRTLINIKFDKLWKDATGTDLGTKNQPEEIYIQLQRRLAGSTSDDDWQAVEYAGSKYVTVHHKDSGWLYTFSNLDQYPVDDTNTNYQYRIVEGTVKDGSFTAANGSITIGKDNFTVSAISTADSVTDSEGNTTTPAKATDGTITGGSGTIVLTNTLQNPKFVLDIIKKDAEKDEKGNEVFLKDVEFKLEKLKAETTTEGEPQVDKDYQFDNTNKGSITAITNGSGEITNVFKDLEPGTYRLTETKAHKGYNLLAQPIVIEFTQDGECYIDGQIITDKDKFAPSGNTYTMTLTVLNRKTPELPHTGADAPSLWLLIGMPLAVAGLLIFTFRYNRKGGRRH